MGQSAWWYLHFFRSTLCCGGCVVLCLVIIVLHWASPHLCWLWCFSFGFPQGFLDLCWWYCSCCTGICHVCLIYVLEIFRDRSHVCVFVFAYVHVLKCLNDHQQNGGILLSFVFAVWMFSMALIAPSSQDFYSFITLIFLKIFFALNEIMAWHPTLPLELVILLLCMNQRGFYFTTSCFGLFPVYHFSIHILLHNNLVLAQQKKNKNDFSSIFSSYSLCCFSLL